MKKRIGSKLYDTETSEHISWTEIGDLFRKKTREREWFLVCGEDILPLKDKEARALLGENVYHEKPPKSVRIMIGVDRVTHEKIARAAKKKDMAISEFMREWAKEL